MAAAAPGDFVSTVVEARLPGPLPRLVLTETLPAPDVGAELGQVPEAERAARRAAYAAAQPIDFVSPRLSAFWGRPIHMRGWIALPPGYRAGGPRLPGRLFDRTASAARSPASG